MSPLIRLYPACNTGYIQAIDAAWVSRCAKKFTCTVHKLDGGSGKMVEDNHAHQTQEPPHLLKKLSYI